MKRKLKALLIIAFVLLASHVMRMIDFRRVNSFQKPLLCIEVNSPEDDGIGKYIGFGYSFNVKHMLLSSPAEYTQKPAFTYYAMRLLGIKIDEAHADVASEYFHGEVVKVEESENNDGSYTFILLDYDTFKTKEVLVTPETIIRIDSNATHQNIELEAQITAQTEYYLDALTEDKDDFIYPAYIVRIRE